MRRFVLSLFLLLIALSSAQGANTLMRASLESNRLLLHFSQPIVSADVKQFSIKSSERSRYVFDFKNTRLRSHALLKSISHPNVRAFRISQFTATTTRIVIEVAKPYPIYHRKSASNTYRVSLPQITKPGKKSPSKLFAALKKETRATTKAKRKPHVKILKGATRLPKRRRYTVVLDAGHGGKDSGALGDSRRHMEKTVVLQIAKRIRKHLKSMGIRVHMTRTSDRYVKLGRRTRYANTKHADIFVSVHANSVRSRKRRSVAHGVETYFLQITRSERAKRVAARENSVVLNKKDWLSKNVILNAVLTGPKIVLSNKLAIDVQRGMLKNLRLRFRSVKDGGVRPAPFWVLVGAQMPSVLVEVGYISNPWERKRLFDARYQELIAKGISEGIANYLANREREIE